MININNDLSNLTTIPESSLNRLTEKATWCIVNAFQESLIDKDNIASVDLGYGILHIGVEDDIIRYKFTPSKSLEMGIKKVVEDGENILINNIDKCLVNKITRVYKDFI